MHRLLLLLLFLFTNPSSQQTTTNSLSSRISSTCRTNLQPNILPDLLPAIQAAALSADPPITNFTLAFQSLVLPPFPPWFTNLSSEYQAQISDFSTAMDKLRKEIIRNQTLLCENSPSNLGCGNRTTVMSGGCLNGSLTDGCPTSASISPITMVSLGTEKSALHLEKVLWAFGVASLLWLR